jgi:hypothetical protein
LGTPTPKFTLFAKGKKTRVPFSRLGLEGITSLSDALQDLLMVLVELELGDDYLGGVQHERNALAVGFLTDDTLEVDNPLKTVEVILPSRPLLEPRTMVTSSSLWMGRQRSCHDC